MEAIVFLGGVWFLSKRLFNWQTNPFLLIENKNPRGGSQVEYKQVPEYVRNRTWDPDFNTGMGNIDVFQPINGDDEVKDLYYPIFARDELVQPRAPAAYDFFAPY